MGIQKKNHQKWSFGFGKAKFGMLDKDYVNIVWKLFEVEYSNFILYESEIFEWVDMPVVRLPDPTVHGTRRI